ncbi:hypothetical protein HG536_0E02020 [Torulaspora globosa]|uniref:Protein LOT5 n=1 Tax=Torulaspora globosa TaxID=48254 RepID=A0A7G3ZIF5_9SACH|nr:uncharacterized protein HG536_0E02020 [Torulaspora globosa]QLL33291.1 hypothetical protein HG536_0E02020 [Torulaspora globosa]
MDEDKPECRLAYVKPTVENVVAYNRYKKTQPMVNGVSMVSVPCLDMPILFGGGRDFDLLLLQHPHNVLAGVDLFILSNAILLWFDHLGCGIEAPYSSVIYHGSVHSPADREGRQLSMLVTLDRDPLLNDQFPPTPNDPGSDSLELLLRPRYSLYDRHYNPEIDTLFNFQDFGVNRGDQMVNNCHEAIATCLEIYNTQDPPPDLEQDEQELLPETIFAEQGTIG